MKRRIVRLDDACEKMDIEKWKKVEMLLDKYGVKPLVGVIPHCEDHMMDLYPYNTDFWTLVECWIAKGWVVAMHGYNHVYETNSSGINPVNSRSEFAGETIDVQREKIKKGIDIFHSHNIYPKVFFAPSHTFDNNTLEALKFESDIRIISDTIAWDSYNYNGFTFVPVQSGKYRALPFKTVTYCFHPNSMEKIDFEKLETALKRKHFASFPVDNSCRKRRLLDRLIGHLYFLKRRFKR